MKRWILVVVGALVLAGCQTVATTSPTMSPQTAVVAVNTFDALEVAATGYLQLPACSATVTIACRQATAVRTIVPAIRLGRTARNVIEAALISAGGGAIPLVSYNTLNGVITTLQSVYTQYGIQHQ